MKIIKTKLRTKRGNVREWYVVNYYPDKKHVATIPYLSLTTNERIGTRYIYTLAECRYYHKLPDFRFRNSKEECLFLLETLLDKN